MRGYRYQGQIWDVPDSATSPEQARAAIQGGRARRRMGGVPPPARVLQPASKNVVGRAKEWLTREPPAGSRSLFGEPEWPGRAVRAIGELGLPSTWTGLAMDLASAGLGTKATRIAPWYWRILARKMGWPEEIGRNVASPSIKRIIAERLGRPVGVGAVGYGTAKATGEDPTQALWGMGGQLGGEATSMAGGSLARRYQAKLSQQDIEQIAEALQKVAPDAAAALRGVRTPGQLFDVMLGQPQLDPRRAVQFPGFQELLGRAYDRRSRDVAELFRRGWVAAGQPLVGPEPLVDVASLRLSQVPITKVLKELRFRRPRGWTPEGVPKETEAGKRGIDDYGAAIEEVRALLGRFSGLAADEFDKMREIYKPGVRMRDLFEAVDPSELLAGGKLSINALRKAFMEYAREVGRDLSPEAYAALHRGLFRGAETGTMDFLGRGAMPAGVSAHLPGPGGFRQWMYARIPGLAPQYAGEVPRKYRLGGYPTAVPSILGTNAGLSMTPSQSRLTPEQYDEELRRLRQREQQP